MSDHEEFNVEPDEVTDVDNIESQATMPIGVDGFGSDSGDLTYGAGGSAAASKGWMVIVAVIILAVGGLFAMHSLAKVTAGTGGDAAIDGRIENFLIQLGTKRSDHSSTAGELINGITIVTTVLEDNYSQLQVPLKQVQFNPFAINRDASPAPSIDEDPLADADRLWTKQRNKRRAEIEHACDNIGLKSVMLGRVALANIQGQIVRLGEHLTIEGIDFNVTKIAKDHVTLTAKDAKFKLVVPVVLELELDR